MANAQVQADKRWLGTQPGNCDSNGGLGTVTKVEFNCGTSTCDSTRDGQIIAISRHIRLTIVDTRGTVCYSNPATMSGADRSLATPVPAICSTLQDDLSEKQNGDPECDGRGNPCNPANGNKFQADVDFRSPALSLIRYYNSNSNTNVGFGSKWNASPQRRLVISGTSIRTYRDDGRAENFTCTTSSCQGDADTRLVLAPNPSGYLLSRPNGSREQYDSNGRLQTLTQPNSQTTSYTYDGQGHLTTVTGPFGHTLAFNWDAAMGVYTRVTLPDTNTITYGYTTGNGGYKLTSVTYPDNTSRIYHFESTAQPFHLTGITLNKWVANAPYRDSSAPIFLTRIPK